MTSCVSWPIRNCVTNRRDKRFRQRRLVHEAYLRLVDTPDAQQWDSRGHFFCRSGGSDAANPLVENARRKKRLKRGGDLDRCEIDEVALVIPETHEDLLALDEALT